MSPSADSLVFDATILSCFARADRLETLSDLTSGYRRVVVEAVLGELRRGAPEHPALKAIEALPWIEPVRVDTLEGLRSFGGYVRILGTDARHIGEAATLAWPAQLSLRARRPRASARQPPRRQIRLAC